MTKNRQKFGNIERKVLKVKIEKKKKKRKHILYVFQFCNQLWNILRHFNWWNFEMFHLPSWSKHGLLSKHFRGKHKRRQTHTRHHQRSHLTSPLLFVLRPTSPSQRWTPPCVCGACAPQNGEEATEKLQSFHGVHVLRWEGNWDECQSESRAKRWEGIVSCHIWGEMGFTQRSGFSQGSAEPAHGERSKNPEERKAWRDKDCPHWVLPSHFESVDRSVSVERFHHSLKGNDCSKSNIRYKFVSFYRPAHFFLFLLVLLVPTYSIFGKKL